MTVQAFGTRPVPPDPQFNQWREGYVDQGKMMVEETGKVFSAPLFYARQGNDPSHWADPITGAATNWLAFGVNTLTGQKQGQVPGMQCGAYQSTVGSSSGETETITFPVAFLGNPIVFVQAHSNASKFIIVNTHSLSTTGFSFDWATLAADNVTNPTFFWWAVGQLV